MRRSCFKGNFITWSKGKRVQIVTVIQLTLAFIYVVTDGLKLWVVGSDIAGTTQLHGGPTSEGTGQMSWWQPELSLLLNNTTSLGFYSVDGTPSYAMNKLNGLLSSFSYFLFFLKERWVSKQLSACLCIGWD